MGYKVIALEHEAYGMVSVGIPVAILEIFGRFAVNVKVTAGISVKAPIMFKRVVLPQPDGPRIETNSFSRKSMLTPLRAETVESPTT